MTPTSKILRDARALLVEKGWTQQTMARDKSGKSIDARSRSAACFCCLGAIERAALRKPSAARDAALFAFRFAGAPSGVVLFNDAPNRTLAEVLAVIDRAVEMEEAAP